MGVTTAQKQKIGNKRLLTLATKLDSVLPHRFDFRTWVGADWKGKPDLSCGTVACAMGYATTIPSFRRLGLKLTNLKTLHLSEGEYPSPVFEGAEGYAAASGFFHISYDEAKKLFSPFQFRDKHHRYINSQLVTPKMVAQAIRAFVKQRESQLTKARR